MTTINNSFNYNDLASLNSITKMGQTEEAEALKQVAQQFESMFVTMMLKSMRDANAVFEEDNPLNTNESKFYRQMFDDQLALSMSEGKGIGLADSIYRQMSNQFNIGNEDDFDKPDIAIPLNQERAPNPFSTMRPGLDLPQFTGSNIEPINEVPPAIKSTSKLNEINVQDTDKKTESAPQSIKQEINNVVPIKLEPVSKQSGFETPEEFVKTIWPIAEQIGKKMGVEPKAIISQAALETGWGKHIIHESNGKNSHNLFGIKSDSRWNGPAANVSTLEFRNGVAQKEVAAFRSYDSYSDSLNDYAKFVKNSSRYEAAVNNGSSIKEYSEGLQNGGYATDPDYAKKIQRIASGDMLNNLIDNHVNRSAVHSVGKG